MATEEAAETQSRAPYPHSANQRRRDFSRTRLRRTADRTPTPHPHPGRDYPTARSPESRNAREWEASTPTPLSDDQVRTSPGLAVRAFDHNNLRCVAMRVNSSQLLDGGILGIARDAVERGRTMDRRADRIVSDTSSVIAVYEEDFGEPLTRVWRNASQPRRPRTLRQRAKRLAAWFTYR